MSAARRLLLEALRGARVASLDLRGCTVDEPALRVLRSVGSLRRLLLSYERLDGALSDLQRACPSVFVDNALGWRPRWRNVL